MSTFCILRYQRHRGWYIADFIGQFGSLRLVEGVKSALKSTGYIHDHELYYYIGSEHEDLFVCNTSLGFFFGFSDQERKEERKSKANEPK